MATSERMAETIDAAKSIGVVLACIAALATPSLIVAAIWDWETAGIFTMVGGLAVPLLLLFGTLFIDLGDTIRDSWKSKKSQ